VILIVLSGIGLVRDAPYTGPRGVDLVGAGLSVLGMGGIVLGILVWQEGGDNVALLIALGVLAMAGLLYWLARRKREGKPMLLTRICSSRRDTDSGSRSSRSSRSALGAMMIALPIYLQFGSCTMSSIGSSSRSRAVISRTRSRACCIARREGQRARNWTCLARLARTQR
jgi:LPXTG-motif cell wall-anchored protein